MKTLTNSKYTCLVCLLCYFLGGCSFAVGQLHDKAMEDQLLKPGALDVGIAPVYDIYSFKFLNKYRVRHDYISTDKCHYATDNAKTEKFRRPSPYYGDDYHYEALPIYELDGHTLQSYPLDNKPKNLDRYVRSAKAMNPKYKVDVDRWDTRTIDAKKPPIGYEEIETGLKPMCGQVWAGTSHSLSVSLVKFPLDAAIKRYTEPNIPLEKQTVGNTIWVTQTSEIKPREINTYAGAYLAWLLPVGSTDYTFVFKLGANQDSLKHPEAHARMQAIFRHLIESVKIEPIAANAK